jgi:hypothetical protein
MIPRGQWVITMVPQPPGGRPSRNGGRSAPMGRSLGDRPVKFLSKSGDTTSGPIALRPRF